MSARFDDADSLYMQEENLKFLQSRKKHGDTLFGGMPIDEVIAIAQRKVETRREQKARRQGGTGA
jgi:hypothetical protein